MVRSDATDGLRRGYGGPGFTSFWKAYRERPVTNSLLSRNDNAAENSQLPQDIEAVFAEALQEFYTTRQKPSVSIPVAGEYAAKCACVIRANRSSERLIERMMGATTAPMPCRVLKLADFQAEAGSILVESGIDSGTCALFGGTFTVVAAARR